MDGLPELWQTLKYDVCCTSENPMPVSESVWSMYNVCKQADTVHGYQQWQDTLAPSMSSTDDAWHTDTFSC